MKKLYKVLAATGLAFAITGCGLNEVSPTSTSKVDMKNLDEKTMCSSSYGVTALLATATKYNAIAKEHQVEFKRLGMTTTQYIDETTKAVLKDEKMVVLLDAKAKPTKNKVTVEYAAQRACKFAVSALTQEAEGKKTWRAAVPGDGFKY